MYSYKTPQITPQGKDDIVEAEQAQVIENDPKKVDEDNDKDSTPMLDAIAAKDGASGGNPAKAAKPEVDVSPWYVGPPDCTMPDAIKAIAPEEREIRSFFPPGATTPVKLFTTKSAWIAYKKALSSQRYAAKKAEAAAVNAGTLPAPRPVQGIVTWVVVADSKKDLNGLTQYTLDTEIIAETDPYKLGFTTETYPVFDHLHEYGWKNERIQALMNIKPGFHTDFPMKGKPAPSADGGTSNTVRYTEYAWKNRDQLPKWVRGQLEQLAPKATGGD